MDTENLMITLEPMQVESYRIDEQAKHISITDAVSYDTAVTFLKEVNNKLREFKAQRDKYIKPMKDSIKAIDERLKEPIKLLEDTDTTLRQKLNAYLSEVRKREEERLALERKKREDEAIRQLDSLEQAKSQAGEYDEVTQKAIQRTIENQQNKAIEATVLQDKINLSTNSASVSMVWDFEVTDKSQLPLEFLKVDEVAIRNAIRNGQREIAGVKIFQKPQISLK
jgi:predicted DNA-binding protein (UPF0251 family)